MRLINKRLVNTGLAIIISLALATANLAGLYYFDKSIGHGNVQVIQTALDINANSFTRWSFGIVPNVQTVPADQAERENLRIWARPGDYAGTKVIGITFALSALMWFVWIGCYLGFPGSMSFVKQRLLGIMAATVLTILSNLLFARMTTEFSLASPILGSGFGYFSLGLNAGGIWFITLLSRLGIGQHESRPTIPASHMKDEKLSALLMSLVVAFILETLFRRTNLALSNLSVDFVVWAITFIAFFNYYGYIPSKWLKGERPYGLLLTLSGTVATILVLLGIQHLTGGTVNTALFTAAGSPGLSLTLSLWLLFWLSVSNQLGKSSPVRVIR